MNENIHALHFSSRELNVTLFIKFINLIVRKFPSHSLVSATRNKYN